jgi:hypothetical protein
VLCFFLDFNRDIKKGQIAHIDRQPSNNTEDNLVYLCLSHHEEYDSQTSQSKRLQKEELLKAKAGLEKWIQENHERLVGSSLMSQNDIPEIHDSISPEVFRLRIPVYKAFSRLASYIMREANISDEELFRFLRDTHDALFLFGEEIENYLHGVYRKAVELRTLSIKMEHPEGYTETQWERIVDKQTECIIWFSDQIRGGKKKFYTYLKV